MARLPRPIRCLRRARLADDSVVDLRLEADVVATVTPADFHRPVLPDELDLDGFLLVAAPAEPHAHLDKAQSWNHAAPPAGDLAQAVESWRTFAERESEEGIYARARAQALAMLRCGTTAIRSHVDLFGGSNDPLRGVRALVRVRAELAQVLDMQLVALGGEWVDDATFESALDLGVDLMGGAPHMAADPAAELRREVGIAERRGVAIDLHTDESLDGPLTIVEYARLTRGWAQDVSAGHCVRLGTLGGAALKEVIDEVVASDIGVITLPITNLYLQGWEHPVSMPRGLTAVRALLDAGVRVAAGADNVRDPFNPVGRGDALETASLLITAGHLSMAEAITAVTDGARSVMSLPEAGPRPGARAELLGVRADSLGDAIATASMDRYVIHAGNLVAQSHVVTDCAVT